MEVGSFRCSKDSATRRGANAVTIAQPIAGHEGLAGSQGITDHETFTGNETIAGDEGRAGYISCQDEDALD